LPPGTPFVRPRTRRGPRIHPNTAHKVIQHLIQERWLEVRPGIGTAVAQQPKARADRQRLLKDEVTSSPSKDFSARARRGASGSRSELEKHLRAEGSRR
jgi:hypothetical protein